MCGRYQFSAEGEGAALIARELQRKYGEGSWTAGDILPGTRAPVLLAAGGPRPEAELFTWGYPNRGKLIINARAETAAEKPLFREGVRRSRCLIPADGFYEWDGGKRKHFFQLAGSELIYMGGVYARFEDQWRFCILTTAANASVLPVHQRMPLVLPAEGAEAWLSGGQEALAALRTVPPLLEGRVLEDGDQLSLW